MEDTNSTKKDRHLIPKGNYYRRLPRNITTHISSMGDFGIFLKAIGTYTHLLNYTTIKDFAFYNCSSLKDLYCHAESVPTIGPETFNNSPISSATLHVPAASLETYKATTPWSEFGTIVAIDDPTGIKTFESTGQTADGLPDGKYMMNGKIIIVKKGKKYDAALGMGL